MANSASSFRPVVLVTGSTDGIGLTTAKNLAAYKDMNVILHGRDLSRIQQAERAVSSFVAQHSSHSKDSQIFTVPPADLSTINGSIQLAKDVKKLCEDKNLSLSVLMNNAGVYAEKRVITSDGLELTFAVNVVSAFIITSLLLPLLLKQKGSRIVIASSISQCRKIRNWDDLGYEKHTYSAHAAYSESKLMDAMLTMEIAARLKQASIGPDQLTCNCLDPGTVNTKMLIAGWGRCGIEVEDALDETWLCSSNDVENMSGKYFVYQNERQASSSAYDQNERDKLWSMLCKLAPEAAQAWNFS